MYTCFCTISLLYKFSRLIKMGKILQNKHIFQISFDVYAQRCLYFSWTQIEQIFRLHFPHSRKCRYVCVCLLSCACLNKCMENTHASPSCSPTYFFIFYFYLLCVFRKNDFQALGARFFFLFLSQRDSSRVLRVCVSARTLGTVSVSESPFPLLQAQILMQSLYAPAVLSFFRLHCF